MRLLRRSLPLLSLAVGLSMTASAFAADRFDVQQFNPHPSLSTSYFDLAEANVLAENRWELGLLFNYADSPLVLIDQQSGERAQDIVSSQLAADLLFAYGFLGIVDVGVDIPLVIYQGGDSIDQIGDVEAAGQFGLGDIRLVPRVLLLDTAGEESPAGIKLAFLLDVRVPTGSEDQYQGDGSFRLAPGFAADLVLDSGLRVGANLGAMFRENADVENLEVADTFRWGLAASIPLGATGALRIVPEVTGELALTAEELNTEEVPLEWILGAKYDVSETILVEGGFGSGLNAGWGTPDWRAIAGLAYHPALDPDRDDDGILNDEDTCPNDPEDLDGWEDADGCPDPDNDGDGIADLADGDGGSCMNDPEDTDGWEDADGCPDPDNDGDGVRDLSDGSDGSCMNDPEDADGWEDADGCPDPDNDDDLVPDASDGAVDSTGFGACRDEAEDTDQFEDADGCPDPDNDGDGIADGSDQCPLEPEDFDGFEDVEGCPEEGTGLVELTCTAINISERVYFDTDSDVIQERSYELLNQIAGVLQGAAYIRLVRVEGHTDDRGSDDHNMDLSQRRATSVRTYLIQQGIAPERVVAQGFGETQPIGDNSTRTGRDENRRVVFVVVEQDSTCSE